MERHAATQFGQRGWAGLVGLLLVVVIVVLLARTALARYGLIGPPAREEAAQRASSSRQSTSTPAPAGPAPQAPLERARALGSALQQQADDRARQIDSDPARR